MALQAKGHLQLARALNFRDQFGQPGQLSRAADDVHVRRPLVDQFLVLLRHAAENADNLAGMALLVAAEPTQGTINLVLGMLAHAARIEQNHVGVGCLVREHISLPAQRANDELAIEHVHLATDGIDEEFFGHVSFGLLFRLLSLLSFALELFQLSPQSCSFGLRLTAEKCLLFSFIRTN